MSLLASVIRPGPASDGCFTDNIGKLETSWVLHTALPPGILMGSADKHKPSISLIVNNANNVPHVKWKLG